MTWEIALAIYVLVLLVTIAGGVLIGTSIGVVGIMGVTLMSGTRLWSSLGDIVWNTTTSFTLVSIPLFILMGEIILRGQLSGRFYGGISTLLARIPGNLAYTNIIGSAVFSALAGSTVATALTVGTVAMPEMRQRGYDDRLTLGTLTGGGCLGILIPPSIPMIVYGAITQESLLDLFAAGIGPGLVLVAAFLIYVALRIRLSPGLVPQSAEQKAEATSSGEKPVLAALRDTVPVALLITAVLGGMYWGVVTPTEAAAFGCVIAILITLFYGQLTLAAATLALGNAVVTSCVILFITINAQFMSFAVVQAGIGRGIADGLVDLGLTPFLTFCALVVIYAVLGMLMDGLSIMLLTVPVLYPALVGLGFDGVWFGIIIIVLIELGALTPPMGLNLFAIRSITPDTPLSVIAWSSLPYAMIILALCFGLYALPQIALFLPQLMRG